MKNFQIILVTIIMILSTTSRPASAFLGFGDIVFDPKADIVRVLQYGKDSSIAVTSYTGAIQQTLSTVNQTVLRPIQDALMLASILRSSDQIKTLVLGSAAGGTSLLITNPDFYLKQQGVNSLKLSVNSISKADGIYSNSILNSVVAGARVNSDTEGALASLSKSSIPQTIQNDLCEDSKLTTIAINDVKKDDGSYDVTTMKARKQEIYSKLCVGDPGTDKVLAQALTTAGDKTGAGGWDKFLAKTGGDNNYTKTSQALTLIASEQAAKVAAQASDIQRGNGIISKTECVKKSYDAKTGLDICAEESITQNGYQLSEAFKGAINAPLDVLKNAYGTGGQASTLMGLLSSIGSILGSVNAIRNSVSSLSGNSNGTVSVAGTGGDPRLQITLPGQTSSGSLTSITTTTNIPTGSTSYTQDLAGNKTAKDALIKPIVVQLTAHIDSLLKLESVDKDYILAINEYSGYIEGIHSCYQQLITDFPPLADNSAVKDALAYYTTKKATTDSLTKEVTGELSLIGQTRTLVINTKNILTNSNSTQEISNAYDSYLSTIANNNLPTETSGMTREGDVASYKGKTQQDAMDITGMVGDIPRLTKQCATIRADEQLKMNN